MIPSQGLFFRLLLKVRLAFLLKQALRCLITALFTCALLGLFLFHISHTSGRSLLAAEVLIVMSALLLFYGAVWAVVAGRKLLVSNRKLTRWIERVRPDLGSAMTGADDLLKQDIGGASAHFVELHVRRSNAMLGALVHSENLYSVRTELSRSVFLLPLGALIAVLFSIYPSLFSEWRKLLSLDAVPQRGAPLVMPALTGRIPVLGDISIHYRFPAYSGIAPKTESNRSGRIKCLKGSHVTVFGRCDQPVFSPGINTGSGIHVPVRTQGDTLFFSFDVLRNDSYRLSAADTSGNSHTLLQDTILCEEDLPPEAVLNVPSDQRVVRRKETIDLGYRASDDFGLKAINMAFIREQDNREEKQKITEASNEKSLSGSFSCNLAWFNLKEGDRGVIYIEAVDNDAVSGFKSARSSPLYITVLDEGRAHAEIEEKMKVLQDKMVFLLADHLEDGVAKERQRDRIQMKSALFDSKSFDLLQYVKEILLAMESDQKTTDEIFAALTGFSVSFGDAVEERRRALSGLTGYEADEEGLLPLTHAESREMSELEDILFFLSEAKEREKVDNLVSRMEDILFDEKQFEENLANKNEDEKIRALREKLDSMRRELADLFKELMKDHKESQLPQEFLNADALKNLPKDRISEAMKKIEKALNEANADQAYAEMLKLRDLLDQLQSSLSSAASEYTSGSFQREMEMMQNAQKELEQLINQQTRLNTEGEEALKDLEAKIRDAMEKAEARKKEEILRLFKALQDKLGWLAGNAPERVQRQARAMAQEMQGRTAAARDRYGSGAQDQSAQELRKNKPGFAGSRSLTSFLPDSASYLQRLSEAEKMNDELLSLLERKTAPFDDMLSPGERGRLGALANNEGSILERMKALEAGLKAGLENMGAGGRPISDNLQGCKSGLGSAFNRMSEYNLPSAMPSAKSGLYYMMRLQESLKQGMNQMQQGSGMTMVPDFSRSRRSGGRTGLAEGDVEMENRKETVNELKEMIKKAIKEKGPEEFEPENKKYYEKLGN